MRKFKVGDLVRCISNVLADQDCKNKIGRIINIDSLNVYTIEFFKPVKYGHSGDGLGKDGYCWHFNENEIKLYIPILKLFLKEKNNES